MMTRYSLIFMVMFLVFVPSAWSLEGVIDTEPNNNVEQAQPVPFPCDISGTAGASRDVDYFRIDVSDPGLESLFVTAHVKGNRDIKLRLQDDEKQILTESDFFKVGETETMTSLKLQPGVYYLVFEIKHPGKTETGSVDYVIELRSVPSVNSNDVKSALNRALDFLKKNQTKEGYFPGNRGNGGGVVGVAIQAFMGADCLERDDWESIYAGLDYLDSLYQSPESFPKENRFKYLHAGSISKSNDTMYDHGIALTTLIEAYALGVGDPLPDRIRNGLDFLYRAQLSDERPQILNSPIPRDSESWGGWRYSADAVESDLSVTAWQIIAFIAAEKAGFDVPEKRKNYALEFINEMYDEKSGSFGYRPADRRVRPGRAGMGALSLQLLGEGGSPKVERAIRHMFSKAPSWGGEYGGAYPFYYWYYGTRTAYLAGGDIWDLWSRTVCGMLVRHQNANGSWTPFQNEMKKVSPAYVTALGALMLEYCCGSVPVYMRTDKAPSRPTAPPRDAIAVSIESPVSKSKLSGPITFTANPVVPDRVNVNRVSFYLDGELLQELTEPPWTVQVDLGPGVHSHRFKVTAVNQFDTEASSEVITQKGFNRIGIRIVEPRTKYLHGVLPIRVKVDDHPDSPVQRVEIWVNDGRVYDGKIPPDNLEYDFGFIHDHLIVAKAENALGKTAEDTVKGQLPPPVNVTLTATVLDEGNHYIMDLDQSDFAVQEDGYEQEITSFSKELTPVSMIVILDTSGSIRRQMHDVQEAAVQFISQIRPEDRVAVMTFADTVRIAQGFTSDVTVLTQAVRKTRAKGGTALYDSVVEACKSLKREKGRKAIILLTDGKDENDPGTAPGSRHSFEQALEKARESGITVYTLGLGKNISKNVLEQLASHTGGRVYFPPTVKDLKEVYGLIAAELRSQYTLGYSSTNRLHDGQWRNLEVTIRDRDYTVRTKKGYYAPR
jgi:VWFA-related protein